MAGLIPFLLLVLTAAAVRADETTQVAEHSYSLESTQKTYHANLDRLFDLFRPQIQQMILKNGMDPMRLADFTETILKFPKKVQATVKFSNGFLHDLSSLRRTKHITASYNNKQLMLVMDLGWKQLDFNYEYYLKHILQRRGDFFGRLNDADVTAVVLVDLEKYHIELQSVKFIRINDYEFKLAGHIADSLLNEITNCVTKIFKHRVVSLLEDRSLFLFRVLVDTLNSKLPKPARLQSTKEPQREVLPAQSAKGSW